MTIGSTIISPTNRFSRPQSRSGIATSISSLSRSGLTRPMKLVGRIATRTTATCARYGAKKPQDPAERLAAALLGDRLEVVGRAAPPNPPDRRPPPRPPRPAPRPVAAQAPTDRHIHSSGRRYHGANAFCNRPVAQPGRPGPPDDASAGT